MKRRVSAGPLLSTVLSGVLGLSLAACAKAPVAAVVAPVEVSDAPATPISREEFPQVLYELLSNNDRSPAAKLKLAGAVQYQLTRAARLFEQGFEAEAEDMVTGALLLLRHDDELLSATRGQAQALIEAGHAAARLGDAGRSAALYDLSLPVAETDELRKQLKDHLVAIDSFSRSVSGSTALQQLGEKTRAALARSVVDPSAENYIQAKESIISWMHAALSSSAVESQPTNQKERELAMEAYRAVRSGAPAMVALNVRQGAPAAAVQALRDANLERALPPAYISLLEATAQNDAPEAWMALFRQFEDVRSEEPSEISLPRYVNDAASFWAALGLYRSGQGRFENSMPLSMILVEFGMPEVASILLSKSSQESTRADAIAWSLTLVLRGLLELSRTDQLEAARRSYLEAKPLFERARHDLGDQGPDPARAQLLMAALETRHAHVREARTLLKEALSISKTASTQLRLGRLEWQLGKEQEAQRLYQAAVSAAQGEGDLLAEAEAEQAIFELERARGKTEAARKALGNALSRLVVLQKMAPTTISPAAIERHLAGVLQYYDVPQSLSSTYERALEQSRTNPAELEMTLTDMSRAAFCLDDYRLSRRAISQALDLGLPAENAIYIALWHQLLQKRLGRSPDGLSRQVLEQAVRAEGWLLTLRKFGLAEFAPQKLLALASTTVEKTEAQFYSTLALHPKAGRAWTDELYELSKSPAIDLIEVRIAADLKNRHGKKPILGLAVPSAIELP